MKKDEKVAKFDPKIVISQFEQLERAVIDACSIIYLHRVDLLPELGEEIDLITPEKVFRETGLISSFSIEIVKGAKEKTPDEQLIDLALRFNCALISDDGKVLKMAREHSVDYFNALMMVFLLYHRRKINRQEFLEKKTKLLSFSYYAPWIVSAGDRLQMFMERKGES